MNDSPYPIRRRVLAVLRVLVALAALPVITGALLPATISAQTPPPRTVGDVNRDGHISSVDALAILTHVVGRSLPAAFSIDPDGDADCLRDKMLGEGNGQVQNAGGYMVVHPATGPISASDALVVLRHAVGLATEHTCVGFQPDSWHLGWSTFETDTLGVVGLDGIVRPQLLDSLNRTPANWGNQWDPDTLRIQSLVRMSAADAGLVNVDTLYLFPLSPLVKTHALSVGTTNIIARWFGQEISAAYRVIPWNPVRMTMTIAPVMRPGGTTSPDLTVGDTTRATVVAYDSLNHQAAPAPDSVLWTSANPSVATISSDGLITAVAPGSVTISGAWRNLSVSATVTVLSDANALDRDVGVLYNVWFNGAYSYSGPGLFLSNQSFQHAAPWANAAMYFYGAIPRNAIVNDPNDQFFAHISHVWLASYRAILSARNALQHLDDPNVVAALGTTNVLRDKAQARFALGVAHASIAVLYDQGFIIDETTDLGQVQPQSYDAVMAAALTYFDQAIALCGQGSFTLPTSWLSSDGVDNAMLARIAHSLKARYRAAVARTPAERQAVDWNAVIGDIDAGVTATWAPLMDSNAGWYMEALDYGTYAGWSELPYWIYGMADQAGNYQRWLAQDLSTKTPNPADGDIVIVTPDTRFPQGTTIAEQRNNPGHFGDGSTAFTTPNDIGSVWVHPERNQWRWSYYRNDHYKNTYNITMSGNIPEIPIQEMHLLKAEGLYYEGDLAGAASLVNLTRTAAGLNATDASGTNTSCVPMMPNGSCGGLFEMLKWEKRMEIQFEGLFSAPWWFDSRGWGDLWKDTPLELPVPCYQFFPELPVPTCRTFGGAGGEMSAPTSSYHFPGEG